MTGWYNVGEVDSANEKIIKLQNQLNSLGEKPIFKVTLGDGKGSYVVNNPDGTTTIYDSPAGSTEGSSVED